MTVLGELDGTVEVELPSGTLTLTWAARTDVGRRRTVNEDSLAVLPPLFTVADGMGGHAAGDKASDLAVTRLATALAPASSDLVPRAVEQGLRSAAAAIDALSDELGQGAGTTATGVAAASVDGDAGLVVFNLGDSRVYLLDPEADRVVRLTIDHSVVQELVDAGMLSELDAEHHPDSNVITHALGFGETPDPDLWFLPARAGQRVLVCSDGLTKELDDAGIAKRLAEGTVAEAAEALVAQALALGGRDNVTLIAIDVEAAPTTGDAEPAVIRELRRRRRRPSELDDTAEQPRLDDAPDPEPTV